MTRTRQRLLLDMFEDVVLIVLPLTGSSTLALNSYGCLLKVDKEVSLDAGL